MFGDTYVFTLQICAGVAAALLTLAAIGVVVFFVVNVIRRAYYFKPGYPERWRNIIRYAWSDIWL